MYLKDSNAFSTELCMYGWTEGQQQWLMPVTILWWGGCKSFVLSDNTMSVIQGQTT